MKRKRNGAEIKSGRPDDALFPLFPMQNSIPKSITLRGMEKSLKSEQSEGAHMAAALRMILEELLKVSMFLCVCAYYSKQNKKN